MFDRDHNLYRVEVRDWDADRDAERFLRSVVLSTEDAQTVGERISDAADDPAEIKVEGVSIRTAKSVCTELEEWSDDAL